MGNRNGMYCDCMDGEGDHPTDRHDSFRELTGYVILSKPGCKDAAGLYLPVERPELRGTSAEWRHSTRDWRIHQDNEYWIIEGTCSWIKGPVSYRIASNSVLPPLNVKATEGATPNTPNTPNTPKSVEYIDPPVGGGTSGGGVWQVHPAGHSDHHTPRPVKTKVSVLGHKLPLTASKGDEIPWMRFSHTAN